MEFLLSILAEQADDDPNRDGAVERLIEMLKDMIKRATKDEVKLAPFVGLGCLGRIRDDGYIEKGGQNLPGNWEHKRFNLPALIRQAIPNIDGHEMIPLMHNDALVQGLSEVPFMKDVKKWGVMTIGMDWEMLASPAEKRKTSRSGRPAKTRSVCARCPYLAPRLAKAPRMTFDTDGRHKCIV